LTDILEQIIAHKHAEIAAAKARVPQEELIAACDEAPPARSFYHALASGKTARIIAECKKQSPSKGVMVASYDPVALACAYEKGGAAAISVLTDERFFGGRLDDLRKVRAAVGAPVLRKDFIVDAYQIYEARAAGADSYLLLSGVLTTPELDKLIAVGRDLGMEPLIESHTAAELRAAILTHGKIFGINNRNLKSFQVDLDVARQLYELGAASGADRLMVCESGIKSAADVENLSGVGYKAFLVGEALVTHPDPTAALKALIQR
jgi:indole-3-glycerol phosphate synthase